MVWREGEVEGWESVGGGVVVGGSEAGEGEEGLVGGG